MNHWKLNKRQLKEKRKTISYPIYFVCNSKSSNHKTTKTKTNVQIRITKIPTIEVR